MEDVKNLLSVFSQEIRLRIAILLWDSSICVNCLVMIFKLPQSTISRHLSLLRKSGIVRVTRDCTYCYYTIERNDPGLLKQRLIKAYYEILRTVEPYKSDRKKLREIKAACTADCKVHIKKGEKYHEKVQGHRW